MAEMTYTSLRDDITSYTENQYAEFLAKLDDFIRNAELQIARDTKLDVFRKYATAETVPGGRYLTRPEDMVFDRYFYVEDSDGVAHQLKAKDPGLLRTAYPDPAVQGLPRYYADWDATTFVLAPTPDDTYQVILGYVSRPEPLSADQPTTWLTANMPDILLHACLFHAYTFMQYSEKTTEHLSIYAALLQNLKLEEEGNQRFEFARYGER